MTKPAAAQGQTTTDKTSYPGIYRTRDGIIRGIYSGMTKQAGVKLPVSGKPDKQKTEPESRLKKRERIALYKRWTEIVRESFDFQALSINRGPDGLFHLCNYLLQADFATPGHLKVTLYILRGTPISPKIGHDDLRRRRKIWLIPSFVTVKDAKGNETVEGIDIRHDIRASFSVDAKQAFVTIDIETDAVPSQEELDRLFTKKPRVIKEIP